MLVIVLETTFYMLPTKRILSKETIDRVLDFGSGPEF